MRSDSLGHNAVPAECTSAAEPQHGPGNLLQQVRLSQAPLDRLAAVDDHGAADDEARGI